MPKVILEFNLPDEASEHNLALHGADYLLVIDDVLHRIRARVKYDSDNWSQDHIDALQTVRQWIYEFASDRGVEL